MGLPRTATDIDCLCDDELGRDYCGDDEVKADAALTELLRRHEPLLWQRTLRLVGGNMELAQEASQLHKLHLWRKRRKYDPEKAAEFATRRQCRDPAGIDPGPWLAWSGGKMLDRLVISLFEKEARRFGELYVPEAGADPAPPIETAPVGVKALADTGINDPVDRFTDSPLDEMISEEEREAFRSCLRCLWRQRQTCAAVYVLKHWCGLGFQAIADRLHIGVGTAHRYFVEAVARVNTCIHDKLGGEL